MSIDIAAAFEAADESDEFLKFGRIANPLSKRPDLHAFLLLDRLVPGDTDMICASEHDEFFIEVSIEKLAEVATQDDITDLARCGVRYSDDLDCLCMFA